MGFRRPLNEEFVEHLQATCDDPSCPEEVRELFEYWLYDAPEATLKARLHGLQSQIHSHQFQDPQYSYAAEVFLEGWDTSRLAPEVAAEEPDSHVREQDGDVEMGGMEHDEAEGVRRPRADTDGSKRSFGGDSSSFFADPDGHDDSSSPDPFRVEPSTRRAGKPAFRDIRVEEDLLRPSGERSVTQAEDSGAQDVETSILPATTPAHPPPPPQPPQATDPGVGNRLLPDLEDCQNYHFFKHQRQPPVGIRLQHVLNFLADEDVDRCMLWRPHTHQIREYLDFLSIDAEFQNIGPNTRFMLEEAKRRLEAHDIFEKIHGPGERVHLSDPSVMPKPKPRLQPLPGLPLALVEAPAMINYARNVLHRAPAVVNDMYLLYENAQEHMMKLAKDEDKLWQVDEVSERFLSPNLSAIENEEYERAMANKDGWVTIDALGNRTLPGGDTIGTDAKSFARERGARRAGIQQALEYFKSYENYFANCPWRRLVLPIPAKVVNAHKRQAAGIQLTPQMMKIEELPKSLETHPYTVAMAEFKRQRDWWMNQARIKAELENQGNKNWVTLPRFRDAYAFKPFPPKVQHDQELLALMVNILKLLDRALAVAHRNLLEEVQTNINEGMKRGPETPPGKRPSLREVYDFDKTSKEVKLINANEALWIKFLLTGSCNRGMVSFDLSEEFQDAALFHCFANRLQKLMDNLGPNRLFKDKNTQVSLEKLLAVMHWGADNGPKQKAKFSVYDAMSWCNRLEHYGRCRFHEDIEVHGYVQRPEVDMHPEHRILDQKLVSGKKIWLSRTLEEMEPENYEDDAIGAPRRNEEIATWLQTIDSGRPWEALSKEVHNFFCALAFRFGWTYWHIWNREKPNWETMKPVSQASFDKAMASWDSTYEELTQEWNREFRFTNVVKQADPDNYSEDMTEAAAAKLIQHNLLLEAEQSLAPLYPVRRHLYKDADGQTHTVCKRPGVWDWAKPEVCGKARQFFSLDRWPLYLQKKEKAERSVNDEELDPKQLWDPCSEDLTDPMWFRQKARPYTDEKVVHRLGPAIYPIGDTRLQRQAIENEITNRLALALGLEEQKPGLMSRVSSFIRLRPTMPPPIPVVAERDTPRSVDMYAIEAAAAKKAVEEAKQQGKTREQASATTESTGEIEMELDDEDYDD